VQWVDPVSKEVDKMSIKASEINCEFEGTTEPSLQILKKRKKKKKNGNNEPQKYVIKFLEIIIQ
jgi:hypothetical protein